MCGGGGSCFLFFFALLILSLRLLTVLLFYWDWFSVKYAHVHVQYTLWYYQLLAHHCSFWSFFFFFVNCDDDDVYVCTRNCIHKSWVVMLHHITDTWYYTTILSFKTTENEVKKKRAEHKPMADAYLNCVNMFGTMQAIRQTKFIHSIAIIEAAQQQQRLQKESEEE